ncbi:MAG: PKD domain-containing protein, partial [Solirubrobacterales bacterium]|nr:PKD domain-containing protein [Solirubrobacterales bacterium]
MRRYSLAVRRLVLALSCTLVASLAVVASAQAVVVNDNGTQAGVSIVPDSRGASLPSGVTAVTAGAPCLDPWLSADLGGPTLPSEALCYRGGAVIHKNETFALTWDQQRGYWSQTRGYMEQFLRDVAQSSGSLASPFAVTSQYNDGGGRASNASIFGGGCIDYGATGGADCEYGSPTGSGHDFPASGCPVTGDSFVTPALVTMNNVCLTDAQLQTEVSTMVSQTGILSRTQPGYTPLVTLLVPPRVKTCLDASGALCAVNGNLTPPPPNPTSANTTTGTIPAGTYQVVVTYLLSGGGESAPSSAGSVTTVSSNSQNSSITIPSPPAAPGANGWKAYVTQANGTTYTLQGSSNLLGNDLTLDTLSTGGSAPPTEMAYCSYHSQVNVNGTEVAYVVQPWSAGTGCDEPDAPPIPPYPTVEQMAVGVGQRLVSPLSQAEMAAITNPGLNGWAGLDGTEIQDNEGCVPVGHQLDSVTLGSSSQNPYFLQRESNNAGMLEFDPVTYFGCAPQVDLIPEFVVPSAVDEGDVIQFDGSTTDSTLIVPRANYQWNFGDGTTATGPSIVHSYGQGGNYNVTLTVTDRGGNTATIVQAVQVLGATGQPVPPPTSSTGGGGGGSGSGSGSGSGNGLTVHIQMLPQSLQAVLRNGIAVRVTANEPANGIATVTITRGSAKRAGIKIGHSPAVRIGLGTVSTITNGTVTLRLHLSQAMA